MEHRLYKGVVWHKRYKPTIHEFKYPVFYLALNLHSLGQHNLSPLFGYNRWGVTSIFDTDHLQENNLPLLEKINDYFPHGLDPSTHEVILVTLPKLLGYSFNPVSFYFALDNQGIIQHLFFEVRNTFGEMHLYSASPTNEDGNHSSFAFQKAFHVSPFFHQDYQYKVEASLTQETLHVRIDLRDEEGKVFSATLSGRGVELKRRNLLSSIILFPMNCWGVMTRILIQAWKLYFFRKLPVFRKPSPDNPYTLRHGRMSMFDRIRLFVLKFAREPRE